MEAPSSFSGGCACGAVRYECSTAPALQWSTAIVASASVPAVPATPPRSS